MFTESELIPTEVERGLWYYQGIDEVGNPYPDEAETTTMLGAGDSSPSAEDDIELREANIVKHTRSSSQASQQQTTDDIGPSSVHVADKSVPFALSSVLATATAAFARRTCLRFVSSTRTRVPNHFERRFADVISVIEALRQEAHKSDKERKESDRVREEQHKDSSVLQHPSSSLLHASSSLFFFGSSLRFISSSTSSLHVTPVSKHNDVAIMVNGCTGKMGKAVINAADSGGLHIVLVSFGSTEEAGQMVEV
ncbi:hypothetical protein LWI29_037961 [Acer saccharum]|uniref:Uncharacterized protein n=1 Tax=Acer saccharum TaxID=4024 RepID=A0AA39RTU2_ACESA|nr:hypothetical protein LWI29_037961 [Acer saccharum]